MRASYTSAPLVAAWLASAVAASGRPLRGLHLPATDGASLQALGLLPAPVEVAVGDSIALGGMLVDSATYASIAVQPAGGRAPRMPRISADTIRVLPGASYQFTVICGSAGEMCASSAVQYSTTGGTISPAGRYLAPQRRGTYAVVMRAGAGATDTATVIVSSTRFGVYSDVAWHRDPAAHVAVIEQAQFLNASVVRFELIWAYVEWTRGHQDWSVCDDVIARLHRAGIQPLVVIQGSPPWASGAADTTDALRYLDVPTDTEAFKNWVTAYSAFVGAAARRYKGTVHLWEVGNEPNSNHFWRPAANPDQYARWFAALDSTLHDVDPTNQVSVGGLAALSVWYGSDGMSGRDFLKAIYNRGLHPRIVAIHPYANHNQSPNTHLNGAENFDDIQLIRALMVAYGHGSDGLWVTEWGWSTSAISENAQASYVRRSLDLIERNYPFVGLATYYSASDVPAIASFFGLIHANGAPKPAALSFRTFFAHPTPQ